MASIVAAEMTELMPGAGPPPHRMPSLCLGRAMPSPYPSAPPDVSSRLTEARRTQQQATASLRPAEQRLSDLRSEYASTVSRLELAVREVLDAYRARLAGSAQLAEAQSQLDRSAAAAYEL